MSKIFSHVCDPPLFSDWKTWMIKIYVPGHQQEIRDVSKAISLIKVCYTLPKDIWNIIVRHLIFGKVYFNPDLFQNDYMIWMTEWLRDPIQQRFNPLYDINGLKKEPISIQIKVGGVINSLVHSSNLQLSKIVDCFLHFNGIEMRGLVMRCGDLFVGVVCDDNTQSNIEKCEVIVDGDLVVPLMFEEQFSAHTSDGARFYFCPQLPAVPMISIQYQEVMINVQLKNPSLVLPSFKMVYVLCNETIRRSLCEPFSYVDPITSVKYNFSGGYVVATK